MGFSILFREEARQDLINAYAWYENQRIGLGEDFLSEVENSLKYLRQHPEAFPKKRKGFREISLKTFPYLMIYLVNKKVITVFAVFSTHLDPNKKPST